MKIHPQENYKNNIDHYIKIIKKKFSFEGLLDSYKIKQRRMRKKYIRQYKRCKKHLFIRHLRDQR